MPSSTASWSRSTARGVSHFQLLQNALNTQARLRYCIFDLMFLEG